MEKSYFHVSPILSNKLNSATGYSKTNINSTNTIKDAKTPDDNNLAKPSNFNNNVNNNKLTPNFNSSKSINKLQSNLNLNITNINNLNLEKPKTSNKNLHYDVFKHVDNADLSRISREVPESFFEEGNSIFVKVLDQVQKNSKVMNTKNNSSNSNNHVIIENNLAYINNNNTNNLNVTKKASSSNFKTTTNKNKDTNNLADTIILDKEDLDKIKAINMRKQNISYSNNELHLTKDNISDNTNKIETKHPSSLNPNRSISELKKRIKKREKQKLQMSVMLEDENEDKHGESSRCGGITKLDTKESAINYNNSNTFNNISENCETKRAVSIEALNDNLSLDILEKAAIANENKKKSNFEDKDNDSFIYKIFTKFNPFNCGIKS